MNKVIKTPDGYMVELASGDYACDAQGNNTWDTFNEAKDVLFNLKVSKQEDTAYSFGRYYAYVNPSITKNYERKEIASTFYTPKSKVWYAFIRGMEMNGRFPVIAKGAKADIRWVLKRLTESSSRYIEDGTWINTLYKDIADAEYIIENNL